MSVYFLASLLFSIFYVFNEYPRAFELPFFKACVFIQLLAIFLCVFVKVLKKYKAVTGEKLKILESVSEATGIVAFTFSVVIRLIIIKSYSTGMPYALAWYEVGNRNSASLAFFAAAITARHLIMQTPEFHERTYVV